MMEEIKEKLEQRFGSDMADFKSPRPGRIYVRVNKSRFKELISFAKDNLGFVHLSTISGVDLKTEFEIIYHLFGNKIALSLAVKINRGDPHIDTVTDIIPGSLCYERELQDMFGIEVDDIPDNRKLIIPEDWPEGQYPLRKDWKKEMLPSSFNDGLLRNWME